MGLRPFLAVCCGFFDAFVCVISLNVHLFVSSLSLSSSSFCCCCCCSCSCSSSSCSSCCSCSSCSPCSCSSCSSSSSSSCKMKGLVKRRATREDDCFSPVWLSVQRTWTVCLVSYHYVPLIYLRHMALCKFLFDWLGNAKLKAGSDNDSQIRYLICWRNCRQSSVTPSML